MNTFNPVTSTNQSTVSSADQQKQDISQQMSNLSLQEHSYSSQQQQQPSWQQQQQQPQYHDSQQYHQPYVRQLPTTSLSTPPPPLSQQYYPPQQQQQSYEQLYGYMPQTLTAPPLSQATPMATKQSFSPQPGISAPNGTNMPYNPSMQAPNYMPPYNTTNYQAPPHPQQSYGLQQQQQQQQQQPYAPQPSIRPQVVPTVPLSGVGTINKTVPLSASAMTPSLQQSPDDPRRAPKIDPNQMPSPARMSSVEPYQKKTYMTASEENPPSSVSRFKVIDQGACNPRFMRLSLNNLPISKSLLDESQLIMGAVVKPLAELEPDDMPNVVPVVDFEDKELIRCTRCHAYINPFAKFVNNGKQYICNFCGHQNDVERWYMCNLDGYGKRRDLEQRYELRYGSVDIIVRNPIYYSERKTEEGIVKNIPAPLCYVFAIDISTFAQDHGIVRTVINNIKTIVKGLAERYANCRASFMTFASAIHFYNTKNGAHPQIMVVGDVQNIFLPFPGVNMMTFGELAENDEFFDRLLHLSSGIKEEDNVMGSAVVAASELLAEVGGGRILMFSTKLPNIGQGVLKARDDFSLYGTPKEKTLFSPLLGFYKNFGITMARNQICLDLFIFPTTFMESGTLASLTGTTGGHIYLYNNFNEARDSERLYLEMHRNLSRETGSDAVLKVRSSTGISIRRCLGNFHTQVEGDMDLAGVDSDTAFAIEFKHDLKLDEKVPNYIQAAMLYTARDGTRRIRLHTLRVGTIGDISKLFKKADLDATLNIYSRLMIDQVVKNRDALNVVRQMITDKLVAILASYRKNCSPTSNAGQLILPDSLKMLPVYFLGLIKSPALRQGTDVLLDERITMMSQIQEMGCKNILLYCYPQLFNLTNMDEELIDEDGKPFPLPTLNSLSASRLDSSSIYLLNDDINIYIWIGREAPNEALQGLFSIDSIPKFTLETQPQPDVNTAIGDRYARIFDVIRKHRTRHGPIKVIRDRDPNEHMFLARLIEDRSTTAPSYVDYLCNLHKEIQNKLM